MAAIDFPDSPSNNAIFSAQGKTWKYHGVKGVWKTVVQTNGTALTSIEIASNTTLAKGFQYIVGERSANVFLTFPTSASVGDELRIVDGTGQANTFGIQLNRNGHRIQGQLANVIIDTSRAAGGYVYYNANNGWILTEV